MKTYLIVTILGELYISWIAVLTCDMSTNPDFFWSVVETSASSVARLQMSRARRASPESAATCWKYKVTLKWQSSLIVTDKKLAYEEMVKNACLPGCPLDGIFIKGFDIF